MGIQFDDIGVVERIHDFKLKGKLWFHFVLLDDRFEDFFDSKQHACGFMSAKINISKLAWAYLFS